MKKIINAVIIDDEPNAVKSLQTILQEFCEDVNVVATANGALEGVKLVKKYNPDLVFLDVDMPGGNGFDFLEALPEINFKVIFTTASSEYAIQALKAKAQDYLLKPIDIEELNEALNQLKKTLFLTNEKSEIQKLAIPTQGGFTYLNLDDIVHIDNDGSYCTFHLKNNTKHLVSKNIGTIEEQLPKNIFYRCHQSHIINLNLVKEVNRTDGVFALMSNGNKIVVSRANKSEFLNRLGT